MQQVENLATWVRVCLFNNKWCDSNFTLFIYIALFFEELVSRKLLNAEGCIIPWLDNPWP